MKKVAMNQKPIKYLLIAIVQEQDVDVVERALDVMGVHITQLATSGGFLGRRNATLVIGIPEEVKQKALSILKNYCRQRMEYITIPMEGSPLPLSAPMAITVGGARVFSLPVDRHEEI
jgi:uncharacterized protein YaaQ